MLNTVFNADEQTLRPLCGRAVCVILNDDTRYTGILTSCGPSSIVLNGERTNRPVYRTRKAKIQAEENKTSTQKKASLSSYWGTLSLSPPIECSTIKAIIPMVPIRAVWVI
jgi:small nuclear ribonucleoprotein (snRNP)-like protein